MCSRVGETERLVCTRSCNAQTVELVAANSERVAGHSESVLKVFSIDYSCEVALWKPPHH